jgi:hypothetical protein
MANEEKEKDPFRNTADFDTALLAHYSNQEQVQRGPIHGAKPPLVSPVGTGFQEE